jgi:hypothetical protein
LLSGTHRSYLLSEEHDMIWKLSRYRTGDLVEVRSKEEILATLDQHGCVDGLPFMPEMLQYCGQRFWIGAVAHKTCDTARQTWKGRRLQATVHLAGLRCDGLAHGGCQAECNLFWRDDWLKPAANNGYSLTRSTAAMHAPAAGCTEDQLLANTHLSSGAEDEKSRYFCQATEMYEATQPLAWWDVRQYVFDVVTGNHSAGWVLRVLFLAFLRWCLGQWHKHQRGFEETHNHSAGRVWRARILASLRWLLAHVPGGYWFFKGFHDWMHQWLSGRPSPSLHGQIPYDMRTPAGRLGLKPGEYVRIKAQTEIEQTIDKSGKNRGLSFDPEEMAPYCGRIVQVHKSVTKIIDEPTGQMIYMKQPCIMLEGVVCKGEYASCRLNCPRAIPAYWREIWLERVEDVQLSNAKPYGGGRMISSGLYCYPALRPARGITKQLPFI